MPDWAGSARREDLPANWASIRRRVIARDHGLCQWRMSDGSICAEDGIDVDHVDDPHDHRLENLQLLCGWHHARKTAWQGNAGGRRYTARRPAEPHPGLL